MHRKLKAIALAIALSATTGSVVAQDFVFNWNPRSGDVWVDTRLSDINQYGYRYRDPFIDEMNRYYGAPRDLVYGLIVNQRWAPGDVYYACSIAQVIGRPCRYVVDEWERDHGQGWGVIAQRLGIKPGSAEFHRLKRGFVRSYDRWGRPIAIDADLRPDFPNRGHDRKANTWKGKSGKSGKSGKGTAGKKSDHGKARKNDGHGKTGKQDKSGHAGGKSAKDKGGGKGKGKGGGKG